MYPLNNLSRTCGRYIHNDSYRAYTFFVNPKMYMKYKTFVEPSTKTSFPFSNRVLKNHSPKHKDHNES
jgi:hypothetical protein